MICDYGTLQQRKLEIRREDDGQYFDFQFPPQIFKTKVFKTAQELNKEIIRAGIKCFFRRGRVFIRDDYKCTGGMRTIFRCKNRQCSARLLYHRQSKESNLEVVTFKNLHNHKKSKDPEKAKRQQINQFIMNLAGKEYEDFRNIKRWMQKFDLINRESLYIVEQLYWSNNTENQILTRLAYQGMVLRRFIDEDQTMIIFMRSDTMRENYLQFGQTITFDLTYDTLRKPTPFGNKYGVGYFYGQDHNLRLVLFSVCIVCKENAKNFKKLFQFFLDCTCMDQKPFCIITDDITTLNKGLSDVIQQRQLPIHHMINWFHLIQGLKPRLRQIKNGKQVLDTMCKALQQFNHQAYQQHIKVLSKMLTGNEIIFEEFMMKQRYYCASKVPPVFSGYALSTGFGQFASERTRGCTVYRKHTGRLLYKLLEVENMLLRQLNKVAVINTGLIKHYPAEISSFQQKLELRPMDILVRNYSDSRDLKKTQSDAVTYKIYDKSKKQFTVKFLIQYDHWQCDCRALNLMGLPCSHLILILSQFHGALQYYIDSRWFHEKQDKISEHAKPFITNKRRRP